MQGGGEHRANKLNRFVSFVGWKEDLAISRRGKAHDFKHFVRLYGEMPVHLALFPPPFFSAGTRLK